MVAILNSQRSSVIAVLVIAICGIVSQQNNTAQLQVQLKQSLKDNGAIIQKIEALERALNVENSTLEVEGASKDEPLINDASSSSSIDQDLSEANVETAESGESQDSASKSNTIIANPGSDTSLDEILREARRKSYLKYGVPIEKPYLDESVPFQNFSHIKHFAMAGLGHRLIREAAAVYVGRVIGFAVRGYWSGTIYSNNTKDLFSEMFEPYTREEFSYVNSTNKVVHFTNEVMHMTRMRPHNTGGLESPRCPCTNDENQVHYDFYSSLRSKYVRRQMIDSFMRTHNYANHTVFGIHIRAGNNEKGDFTKKGRGFRSGPEQFVSGLVKSIRGSLSIESLPRPPMIFLATDDPKYRTLLMDEMKEQGLSWPVVVLEQEFAEDGVVLAAKTDDGFEMWHSMFQDLLLLSYSDVVIAAAYSSFPQSLPLSLVLGRPEEERTVKDSYCEVIVKYGNNTEAEPDMNLYCYDYMMKWCCGALHQQHRKTLKFIHPHLRGSVLNVPAKDFGPDDYLSFEIA
jgi:hypothetical protein